MGIETYIQDGCGEGNVAAVTTRNELVVGKLDYSSVYNVDVDTITIAFNFVGPKVGMRFVITDILLSTDRNIGNNGAIITIYEATGAAVTTISKTILSVEMLKQAVRDITGLNLIVTEGRWVNIKTDDNSVNASLMGFYVKA